MTEEGIVSVNTGDSTKAYRFTDKNDCDIDTLVRKLDAKDAMFDKELTPVEVGNK